MAKDNQTSKNENGNRVATAQQMDMCLAEGCKKKIERMHFCQEHFEWYKEGLINKRGEHPTDFDKKYQQWMRKKTAA